MSFLYSIIISPIESVTDWVFLFIINKIESVGVIGAVFGVSLAINFLALPLYNIADSLQEKERRIAKSMEGQVKRIKTAFKGDERFMMLQTYYRESHYHPIYTLRASLSILIEIPFFIAAYHYLSHNELLTGASWWIFSDLGAPDTFVTIHIASFPLPVHLLPVLMTLINFVSGAIYTKDAPVREKVQLAVVAVIFLVLLYNSPSGLVIYWILNNIFSLCKNIVMKTKRPVRVAHAAISAIFACLALYVCVHHGSPVKKAAVVCFAALVALLSAACRLVRNLLPRAKTDGGSPSGGLALVLLSGLGLSLLCGFALPASVIATSAPEFSFLGNTASPTSYVWTSFFVFFGFFVFWPLAVYKMFGQKVRRVMPPLSFVLFLCALSNVYVFKYNYGNLSVSFTLDDERVLKNGAAFFTLLPLLAAAFAAAVYALSMRFKKGTLLLAVAFSPCLAAFGIGCVKTASIRSQFASYAATRDANGGNLSAGGSVEKIYRLSRTEKNVIVLFLDRAISSFFPQVLEEFPALSEKFAGFTYYPNTVSFSTHTSLGAPAMVGGYEYTPQGFNDRPGELLRDKHNEALLVLPKLFSDAGFAVTVSDPPWSNYAHEGDLSPFKRVPGVNAYTTFGKYTNRYFNEISIRGGVSEDRADVICRKEIRNFAVLQALYPPVRSTFYRLCRANTQRDDRTYYNIFSSLYYLGEQTDFSSESATYTFIDNDTPHEPHALESGYLQISDKKKSREATHYDANAAALLQTAKFLDVLRENGAYDNSRIIIVADHGQSLSLPRFSAFARPEVPASYNPLLLVKDFGAVSPLAVDDTFMTNADTVLLATADLPVSRENPFTHKMLEAQKAGGVTLYPLSNGEHHADHLLKKTQFTLDKSRGWHVSGDICDEKNWVPLTDWEKKGERYE